MTYCLAIKMNEGLVFAADSRIVAGIDNVTTHRKLYTFRPATDRFLVLLTSGNLGTTQELLDLVGRDLDGVGERPSLRTVNYMFEAARYIGQSLIGIEQGYDAAFRRSGINGGATLILGGQIAGRPPELYLIYPEGNYVAATDETPFLQLGEFKYGKPILTRVAVPALSLNDAARLALVSFDAAMKSNLAVGPPIELGIYPRDALQFSHRLTLDAEAPLLRQISADWHTAMLGAFQHLSRFEWEQ